MENSNRLTFFPSVYTLYCDALLCTRSCYSQTGKVFCKGLESKYFGPYSLMQLLSCAPAAREQSDTMRKWGSMIVFTEMWVHTIFTLKNNILWLCFPLLEDVKTICIGARAAVTKYTNGWFNMHCLRVLEAGSQKWRCCGVGSSGCEGSIRASLSWAGRWRFFSARACLYRFPSHLVWGPALTSSF